MSHRTATPPRPSVDHHIGRRARPLDDRRGQCGADSCDCVRRRRCRARRQWGHVHERRDRRPDYPRPENPGASITISHVAVPVEIRQTGTRPLRRRLIAQTRKENNSHVHRWRGSPLDLDHHRHRVVDATLGSSRLAKPPVTGLLGVFEVQTATGHVRTGGARRAAMRSRI